MVRVLRVVTLASRSGRYGGPYDTARLQAMAAERRGVETRLLAGTLAGDAPSEADVGTTPVFSPVTRWLPLPGFMAHLSLTVIASIWREVRECDVVHISLAREGIPLVALIFARISRRPVILQPHGMLTSRTSTMHRLLDSLIRPLTRGSIWIALTSREDVELREWTRRADSMIHILGNPVPIEDDLIWSFRRRERDGGALFLARLHPRKRVKDFLDAARISHERGWTETYSVVGPDQGDLHEVMSYTARYPNIAYEGVLPGPRVAERVALATAFVLPSRDEPWGNVLATALVAHTPVVVARSAALAADVQKARAGVVVDDGDPEAIANAVHSIVTGQPKQPLDNLLPVLSSTEIGHRLHSIYAGGRGSTHER